MSLDQSQFIEPGTGGHTRYPLHGGATYAYEARTGRRPLDFSQNVSPLGMPPAVRDALARAAFDADRYPDDDATALRQALAGHLGLPMEWILCGNGAADLIYRLAYAVRPRRALLAVPGFSEYEAALSQVGCELDFYRLTGHEDLKVHEDILPMICPGVDLVMLAQPNNPTGLTTDRALLMKILRRCEEIGAHLMVDECFLDFLPERDALTLAGEASASLLVVSAFTKFYGCAGVRLGWCVSANEELLHNMKTAGPPWSVSTLAQAAGIAALCEEEYSVRLRRLIAEERPYLTASLREMGFRVVDGQANFLLFHAEDEELAQKAVEAGIFLRDCRNFRGLGPGWYRVAVLTREKNERLLSFLNWTIRTARG